MARVKTPKTKTDKLVAALLHRGEEELPSSSRKYRTFTRKAIGDFFFVGKAASLRAGKNISTSLSCSDSVKDSLIRDAGMEP